mmetsp:Transcript_6080/g.7726  ORF Transcript_6080/g.7726 Transcript_6080/m.7726 type:complete len:292 (-) Transcript_6080:100-975(-)
MLKRTKPKTTTRKKAQAPLTATSSSNMQQTASDGDTANFLNSMNDQSVIERLRCTIKHAHVFKLPTRQAASVGWRGADWKEKVWQGTVKVVDRNDLTAVLLVEKGNKDENGKGDDGIFAVCPIKEGAVERCTDSSRYFVLRIENQTGRHMFIGVAFNERNDAFDFNTALEDARREREFELKMDQNDNNENANFFSPGPTTDYSLKDGQKIHVAIPNSKKMKNAFVDIQGGTEAFANFKLDSPESVESIDRPSKTNEKPQAKAKTSSRFGNAPKSGGFLLKPSAKDTPARPK